MPYLLPRQLPVVNGEGYAAARLSRADEGSPCDVAAGLRRRLRRSPRISRRSSRTVTPGFCNYAHKIAASRSASHPSRGSAGPLCGAVYLPRPGTRHAWIGGPAPPGFHLRSLTCSHACHRLGLKGVRYLGDRGVPEYAGCPCCGYAAGRALRGDGCGAGCGGRRCRLSAGSVHLVASAAARPADGLVPACELPTLAGWSGRGPGVVVQVAGVGHELPGVQHPAGVLGFPG